MATAFYNANINGINWYFWQNLQRTCLSGASRSCVPLSRSVAAECPPSFAGERSQPEVESCRQSLPGRPPDSSASCPTGPLCVTKGFQPLTHTTVVTIFLINHRYKKCCQCHLWYRDSSDVITTSVIQRLFWCHHYICDTETLLMSSLHLWYRDSSDVITTSVIQRLFWCHHYICDTETLLMSSLHLWYRDSSDVITTSVIQRLFWCHHYICDTETLLMSSLHLWYRDSSDVITTSVIQRLFWCHHYICDTETLLMSSLHLWYRDSSDVITTSVIQRLFWCHHDCKMYRQQHHCFIYI